MVLVVNLMLSWPDSAGLTAGLAVTGVGLRAVRLLPETTTVDGVPRRPRSAWSRVASAFALEAALIAALFTVWQYVANRSVTDAVAATRNAEWVARFERVLHLPAERSVQNLVLPHRFLVEAANLYYDTMHFAVIFVFLLWLFFRHRDRYAGVRTVLAATTLVCLVISFVPVAPPRMLPGFVDTALQYGQSVYGGGANELSAMPSVHVAWAVVVGWYAVRIGRSGWRWLGPTHAVVTAFVVVCTANHWWLDGIVAVFVLVVCAWSTKGSARVWQAWRRQAPGGGAAPPGGAAALPGSPAALGTDAPTIEPATPIPYRRADEPLYGSDHCVAGQPAALRPDRDRA